MTSSRFVDEHISFSKRTNNAVLKCFNIIPIYLSTSAFLGSSGQMIVNT